MEVYFSSTLMWDASEEEIVKYASENGYDGIELWAQHAEFRNYDIERYRELCTTYGVKTVVHAKSWDLNFASLNRGIREASIKEIKSSIDTAYMCGAEEVTIHPPRYTLMASDENLKIGQESFSEIKNYADKKGIGISFEIMEHIKKEIVTDIESLNLFRLNMDFDNVSYTVDLAHCLNEDEFWNNINSLDNVSKIHITNKRGTKLHTPISEKGDFDIEKIIKKLMVNGVKMVVEGFESGRDYERIKAETEYLKKVEAI